jgi:hypothetical protein
MRTLLSVGLAACFFSSSLFAQEPSKKEASKGESPPAAADGKKDGKGDEPSVAPPKRRRVIHPPGLVTPAVEKSAAKGLEYLAGVQTASGAFGSGQYSENISVVSLCGVAMMSGGHMPSEGKYADQVDRALDFVMKNTSPSGFICLQRATSHGPMYDHGFGTLFLAEAYGMTKRPEIREKLKKAVQLIIDTQNHEGGWRYFPQRVTQADVSVTICQIMALRAARNAGISVPKNTVDRCVDYVKKCQNADGGFRYTLSPPGNSQFPRSAAGVVTFHTAGIYEGKEVEKGLDYLMDFKPGNPNAGMRRDYHYFYGHYYAVQAMYQDGGKRWEQWYPAVSSELLGRQRGDGSWYDSFGAEYGTAMACIILQMPYSLLPIFQH